MTITDIGQLTHKIWTDLIDGERETFGLQNLWYNSFGV